MTRADNRESEWVRNATAFGCLERGGEPWGRDFRDHQYGRRVEADRSWTVYHVFTGIPAHVDGAFMIGLSRSQATKSMLALNLRNSERRKQRTAVWPLPVGSPETPAGQS